jgi:hypothetical protein
LGAVTGATKKKMVLDLIKQFYPLPLSLTTSTAAGRLSKLIDGRH